MQKFIERRLGKPGVVEHHHGDRSVLRRKFEMPARVGKSALGGVFHAEIFDTCVSVAIGEIDSDVGGGLAIWFKNDALRLNSPGQLDVKIRWRGDRSGNPWHVIVRLDNEN